MRLAAIPLLMIALAACGSPTTSPSAPATPHRSPDLRTCGDLFTPPPYGALVPVPGIAVRVVDKSHFVIVNATDRDYYYGVFFWTTEDNLVCGRGVTGHEGVGGTVAARATAEVGGGSIVAIPATIAIWDRRCGEGCTDAPIGEYLVPISAIDPPLPGST